MEKRIIAIGGGEIKTKTTLEIDRYIAGLAKARAEKEGRRAVGLFLGTASHDSMPYFNSFRKTYTSVFDIKAEVALCVYGEMDYAKIASKFEIADFVYVGGGDTVYMLQKWKEIGITDLIRDAYERGVIITGLSAGAICWFENMYTDYELMRGIGGEYKLFQGLGWLKGTACPHYNDRISDFDNLLQTHELSPAYAMENDSAIEFIDGKFSKSITSGGTSYLITKENNILSKTAL